MPKRLSNDDPGGTWGGGFGGVAGRAHSAGRRKRESTLLDLQSGIGEHLDAILALFKPGAKITCVVRNPDHGDAGVVIGNDELPEAIREIERRMAELREQ